VTSICAPRKIQELAGADRHRYRLSSPDLFYMVSRRPLRELAWLSRVRFGSIS